MPTELRTEVDGALKQRAASIIACRPLACDVGSRERDLVGPLQVGHSRVGQRGLLGHAAKNPGTRRSGAAYGCLVRHPFFHAALWSLTGEDEIGDKRGGAKRGLRWHDNANALADKCADNQ